MKKNLLLRRMIAFLVVCLILAGSSVPGRSIPKVFSLTPDKLIHCAEYGVLGFFIFRWLCLEYTLFSLARISVVTLILGSLMGVIDENYQRLTPGRTPDFWDWVLDSVGVLLSIITINYLIKRKTIKR